MSLMDKKLTELTSDEIAQLRKPIGIEGLPYPMVRYAKDGKQETVQELGIIDSLAHPMTVHTEMDLKKVQGKLFRGMPIPSMLLMLREMLAMQEPDSKNRLLAVFGDPAFGKSYLFKMVSSIIHPQGAIQVDCGGMNMREIFFRTVIDYGEGVQDVFNKRLSEGKVSQASIEYLNKEFPGAIVTNNGKNAMDWNMIGTPKESEEASAAFERAAKVMNAIYDREGITHLNNSFGIKTVPGVFFEAFREGRPLFLDEFNKSKAGTLDSMQTVLQFLNGEEDSVTIINPMSQSTDDEAMKAITIRREDIKPGFIVGVAGNESKDGDTTHELSVSMGTRFTRKSYVGNPTLMDWEHRISQVWTGLPLTTLYHVFQDFATDKPEEFGEFLIELRQLGLGNKEIAAIPSKELYFLKNWEETRQAVEMVAQQQNLRYQLSNPESALYEKNEFSKLEDEITDATAKLIHVSFRRIIADHNQAIEGTPEARKVSGLAPSISEAFNAAELGAVGEPEAGWHHFGSNLANAMIEDIVNVTKDLPLTRSALISNCVTLGIIPESFKEADANPDFKTLPQLMKYDELRDVGGSDELKAVQGVIMMALRSIYPEMKSKDDEVIPLRNLGRALQELQQSEQQVVLPNADLNNVSVAPISAALAVSNYNESAEDENIPDVDFRVALTAMAMPGYSDLNREKIWLQDLPELLKRSDIPWPEEHPELDAIPLDQQDENDPAVKEAQSWRSYKALMGESKHNFNLAVTATVNSGGSPAFLFTIEDKMLGQTLVIGPEKIDKGLETALQKNDVTYLVKSDAATEEKINDFLTNGTRARQTNGTIPRGTSNVITESLIGAFGHVGSYPDKYMEESDGVPTVKKDISLGGVIVNVDESQISIYKRIIPKAPKAGH